MKNGFNYPQKCLVASEQIKNLRETNGRLVMHHNKVSAEDLSRKMAEFSTYYLLVLVLCSLCEKYLVT